MTSEEIQGVAELYRERVLEAHTMRCRT